jgi:hypothetical protein
LDTAFTGGVGLRVVEGKKVEYLPDCNTAHTKLFVSSRTTLLLAFSDVEMFSDDFDLKKETKETLLASVQCLDKHMR